MATNHDLPDAPQYRHALPVRLMHWINVIAVLVLLASGMQIFNAHPALYWGRSSYSGTPPLAVLPPFPGWLTLPGVQWLALGRRWHFFFAWVLVLNGATYLVYGIASGHFRRALLPAGEELRGLGASFRAHLHWPLPHGEREYNVLQKLAYVGVVFALFPILVLMGLGMSPTLDAFLPGWVDLFGGRQSVRTLHFIAAALLVAFVAVHLAMVFATGFTNNLRSMVTGRYRTRKDAS